jgi:hypothetical protein
MMRRNTPEEKAALNRVMMAARAAALKEGIKAIAVVVVMPEDGQLTQAVTGEEALAFSRLLADGPDSLASFVKRIAAGQVDPLGEPIGRA